MKNSKMIMAILMAMILSTSVLAGCSTTDSNSSLPESSESSSSEASVPEESETTITGVVKETSDTEMVVTLEDGSELTLNVEGLENLSDVAVGDSITINYADEGDVLVASSLEKMESEESSSSASEQSADQQAESNASQSSAPATNSPAATSNSGTTVAAANTNKSAKERAQAVYAANELDIKDWNTPAVNFTAAINQMYFADEDGNVLAYYNPTNAAALTSKLKNQGFYDSRDTKIGAVKAFNDYRGVETDVVNIHLLDDKMENYICYRYDSKTDSFSEFLIPVDGSGSAETTNPDNNGNSNTSSSADLEEAIELVNEYRVENGLTALEVESDLMDLAAIRAEELADNYSHERPDGSHVTSLGYAEIITIRNSASKAIQSWKDSSEHNKIMLSERYGGVGVGCYNGHWVMLFSKA